jgi:hypothetical protein
MCFNTFLKSRRERHKTDRWSCMFVGSLIDIDMAMPGRTSTRTLALALSLYLYLSL